MTPSQLIARKRDGHELSESSIADFIDAFARGEIPDYQMSAWAMAVYFQGLSARETMALTMAMLNSGVKLQWPADGVPRVDKHSTGGLGDKVSLILAPTLACCGVQVPMLSGRALGITGGTLDKLESVSGYRTDLSLAEVQSITHRIGCVITGASPELAPADQKLYALRDVTATVPSIPLITASIMSKKLAESLDSLVLDVKFGGGAFMPSMDQARTLAQAMVDVGQRMGVPTIALLTDMNQPLGRCVGNALEVRECLDALKGNGPADLMDLTWRHGAELLVSVGLTSTRDEAVQLQQRHIDSGAACEKFWDMVAAQGGSRDSQLPVAPARDVTASRAGFVAHVDNQAIGWAVVELGGGRRVMTDRIDHGVGLEMLVRVGDHVERGQPLLRVHCRPHTSDGDLLKLLDAVGITDEPVAPLKLIHERLAPNQARQIEPDL